MKLPDLDRIRAATRAELGAEPEPPPGMFDDDVPPDAYDIPEPRGAKAKVVPIRKPGAFDPASNVVAMTVAVEDALIHAGDRLARQQGGKMLQGSPCGLTHLDTILDGWQRRSVYVVGGRTGMGKSIVGLNISLGLAGYGEPTLYMSLEMGTREQAMRALFASSRVDSWRWKSGSMRPEDWRDLTVAARDLSRLPWYFDDSSTLTIEQLRGKLEYMKRRCTDEIGTELHTVVVDHVLLLSGSNDRQPRREQVDHINKTIKVIAKDLNLCVIALMQLNRAVEARSVKDKRPQMSDLRESGSSEQDADAIILLYRKDYYTKNKKDWDYELEAIVPKVRGGEPGFAKFRFNGSQQRIDNLEADAESSHLPPTCSK